MYLRKIKRPQGVYLAIQESYYDSSSRQSRTRTVQSLGYLEALKAEYDDPIAFLLKSHGDDRTKEDRKIYNHNNRLPYQNEYGYRRCPQHRLWCVKGVV